MAVSNSSDFTVSAEEVVTEALTHLGVLTPGSTASSDRVTAHLKTLNLMIKAFVPRGLNIWATERITIFLDKDKEVYTVGDRVIYTDFIVRTKLTSDVGAGSTTIIVEDSIGIESSDSVGIQLDTGDFHWTTASSGPTGNSIPLVDGLPESASDGNVVYSFDAGVGSSIRNFEVKEVLQAFLRSKDLQDTPMNIVSREEYWSLGNKTDEGAPNQIFFQTGASTPRIYIYPRPDTITDTVEILIRRNIKDLDETTNNPDFPQEWFEALYLGLAWRVSNVYRKTIREREYLGLIAEKALKEASGYDKEQASVFITPERRFK